MLADNAYSLSTHVYANTVFPEGYQYLEEFFMFPYPTWIFRIEDIVLAKSVIFLHEEQTVFIRYQIVSGDADWVRLELKPLTAFRPYPVHEVGSYLVYSKMDISHGTIAMGSSVDEAKLFLYHNAAIIDQTGTWYKKIHYPEDRQCGLEFEENLYAPCRLVYTFVRGGTVFLCASLNKKTSFDPAMLIAREEERRMQLLNQIPATDDCFRLLAYSAESLVMHNQSAIHEPGARKGKSAAHVLIPEQMVLTNYPNPEMKIRDLLIGFHGLFLTRGQLNPARQVLSYLASLVDDGLLPKRITDEFEPVEFNAVDLPLWFIHVCYEYFRYFNDRETVSKIIFPVLESIVKEFVKGTRFNIQMTRDGLISCRDEDSELTWMDFKLGDFVITPRPGMAVEIQALWYNALCEMAVMAEVFESADSQKKYVVLAKQAKKVFNQAFWFDIPKGNKHVQAGGYLLDTIFEKKKSNVLRPNQILALGLPFPILDENIANWKSVVDVVKQHLLTPVGLRTLAPFEEGYQRKHNGSEFQRAYSCFQGTVRPWLLVPYVIAAIRVEGNTKAIKEELASYFKPFCEQVMTRGLGFISESFDGEPPHEARGALAAASSLGACLELQEILKNHSCNPNRAYDLSLIQLKS